MSSPHRCRTSAHHMSMKAEAYGKCGKLHRANWICVLDEDHVGNHAEVGSDGNVKFSWAQLELVR